MTQKEKQLLEDWDVVVMEAVITSKMKNEGEIDWKDVDDVVEALMNAARLDEREKTEKEYEEIKEKAWKYDQLSK